MSELSGNIATIDPSTQDHLLDSDVRDNNNSDDKNSAAEPSPAGLFGESEGREDAKNSNNGSEPTTNASVPTITRGENKYLSLHTLARIYDMYRCLLQALLIHIRHLGEQ